jgi:hypothetical protein
MKSNRLCNSTSAFSCFDEIKRKEERKQFGLKRFLLKSVFGKKPIRSFSSSSSQRAVCCDLAVEVAIRTLFTFFISHWKVVNIEREEKRGDLCACVNTRLGVPHDSGKRGMRFI